MGAQYFCDQHQKKRVRFWKKTWKLPIGKWLMEKLPFTKSLSFDTKNVLSYPFEKFTITNNILLICFLM